MVDGSRFEDCVRQFCREWDLGDWTELAKDAARWHALTDDFVTWAADATFDVSIFSFA